MKMRNRGEGFGNKVKVRLMSMIRGNDGVESWETPRTLQSPRAPRELFLIQHDKSNQLLNSWAKRSSHSR